MNTNITTVARTAALAIVLLNQIAVAFGFDPLPFGEADAYAFVSTALTGIVAVWTWWKDNPITKAAIDANAVLQLIRDGSVTFEQIMDLTRGGE